MFADVLVRLQECSVLGPGLGEERGSGIRVMRIVNDCTSSNYPK